MKKMKYSTKQKLVGLAFVSPWIIGFLVFTLLPFFQTIQYSFSTVRFLPEGIALDSVGFDNFVKVLLVDPDFLLKLPDYAMQIFIFVPMVVILSIIIALLLNTPIKAKRVFRAIYFLPVILMSGPVIENLMKLNVTKLVGVDSFFVYEFIAKSFPSAVAMPILYVFQNVVLFLWFSGVQILIFLSALQKNDKSTYEAARVDGASTWQQFWKITLPIIKPFIFLNLIYTIVDVSNSAVNPFISIIKKAMFNGQKGFGFSAAATWLYFFLILIAVIIAYLLLGRGDKQPQYQQKQKTGGKIK